MNDTDPHDTEVSVRVVNEVAAAKGVDPTELDPLSAFVDLESVDALIENSTEPVRIECSFGGVQVEIDSDGEVQVTTVSRSRPA